MDQGHKYISMVLGMHCLLVFQGCYTILCCEMEGEKVIVLFTTTLTYRHYAFLLLLRELLVF